MSENTTDPSFPTPPFRSVAEIRKLLLSNRIATDEKIRSARLARDSLKTPVKASNVASEESPAPGVPIASHAVGKPDTTKLGSQDPWLVPAQQPVRELSQIYSISSLFGSPNLGPEEFVLGLPLGTDLPPVGGVTQRTAYINAINAKSGSVARFINHQFPAPEELAGDMEKLLVECQLIATHPDLPYKEANAGDVDFEKEFRHHISISPKFAFLEKLFAFISELPIKVEIVASPGRTIDMLEIFFRGLRIQCTRRDRPSQLPRLSTDKQKGSIKVALLPSGKSGAVVANTNFVIAMDSTFVPDAPEIARARRGLIEVGKLAPLLRLVSLNTIEHILLCYKSSESRYPAVYPFIETTKNLLHDAGTFKKSYEPTIITAASNIAEWLSKTPIRGAPNLTGFPLLPGFEHVQVPQTLVSELHDKRKREGEPAEKQSPGTTPPASSTLQTKRLRVADPMDTSDTTSLSQKPGNTIRASDSMSSQSFPFAEPVASVSLSSSPMHIDGDDGEGSVIEDAAPPKSWVYIVDEKIDKMGPEELRRTLKGGKQSLREWKDFAALTQETIKKQRQDLTTLRAEKDGLAKTLARAELTEKRLSSDLSRTRDDVKQANAVMQKMRDDLLSAPDPQSTIARLRDENEQLQKKLETMDKKEKSRDAEFEFVREQYQNATSAVVELRKELDETKKDKALYERRAAETVFKVHQTHLASQLSSYQGQIADLQSRLNEREARLFQMQERASGMPLTRNRAPLVDRAASTTLSQPHPYFPTPVTRADRSTNTFP